MKLWKRLAYLAYMAIVCLALLELAVRIWGYSERYIYDPVYEPFPNSSEIPYVHKPCLHHARARGLVSLDTDKLGLRTSRGCVGYGPPDFNEIRIAIAGDSVTFGEGVPRAEDTYPEVLERILDKKLPWAKVRVFNFGVSAYSVREMVAVLQKRMLALDPKIVIMAVIPHDFDLGRTGRLDKWGYTVHSNPESLLGRHPRVRNFLRNFHILYLVRDLYYGYLGDKSVGKSKGKTSNNPLPASYVYVKRFAEIATKHHKKYIILLLPALDRSFSPQFIQQLKRDGIVFLDVSDLVKRFSRKEFMASRFDAHPSAAVHKVIASKLAGFILTNMKSVLTPANSNEHTKTETPMSTGAILQQ